MQLEYELNWKGSPELFIVRSKEEYDFEHKRRVILHFFLQDGQKEVRTGRSRLFIDPKENFVDWEEFYPRSKIQQQYLPGIGTLAHKGTLDFLLGINNDMRLFDIVHMPPITHSRAMHLRRLGVDAGLPKSYLKLRVWGGISQNFESYYAASEEYYSQLISSLSKGFV